MKRDIPRPWPLLKTMKLRPERYTPFLTLATLLHMVARKRRAYERGFKPNTFRLLTYPKWYGHRLRVAGSKLGPYKP